MKAKETRGWLEKAEEDLASAAWKLRYAGAPYIVEEGEVLAMIAIGEPSPSRGSGTVGLTDSVFTGIAAT